MTIKDIAKACGVSVSTVSRVLNNHPDVSDAVRRTVLAAVEDMGYIPNHSARDLVRSQSDNIGVVVRGTGNLFFSEMLKTVSHEIERNGYTMVVSVGVMYSETRRPSIAMTDTSSGTRRPLSCSAFIAAMPVVSDRVNTAVKSTPRSIRRHMPS